MQSIPALFVADALALDFLNSVATPVDVPVEWLDDGEGLLHWLKQAQLVSAALLEELRSRFSPDELNKVADQARALREWFRAFVRGHQGQPLTRDHFTELERLNRLLEGDRSFVQIAPVSGGHGRGLELQAHRKWNSPDALLLPIAE